MNKFSVLLDMGSTNKAGIKMIQQVKLLFGRGAEGEMSSSRENNIKATLGRIFGSSQKDARILTVHGSTAFNTYLLDSISDIAGLTRVQGRLRHFRSKPHFDMLFYSNSQNAAYGNAGFLEDLCYCRILLKPGASLFLVMEGTTQGNVARWFTKEKSREVSWLRQAGFANITTQKIENEFVLVGGQRPWQNF